MDISIQPVCGLYRAVQVWRRLPRSRPLCGIGAATLLLPHCESLESYVPANASACCRAPLALATAAVLTIRVGPARYQTNTLRRLIPYTVQCVYTVSCRI